MNSNTEALCNICPCPHFPPTCPPLAPLPAENQFERFNPDAVAHAHSAPGHAAPPPGQPGAAAPPPTQPPPQQQPAVALPTVTSLSFVKGGQLHSVQGGTEGLGGAPGGATAGMPAAYSQWLQQAEQQAASGWSGAF